MTPCSPSFSLRCHDPVRQIRRDHAEVAEVPGINALGPYLAGAGKVEGVVDDAARVAEVGCAAEGFHVLFGGRGSPE